MNPSHLTRREFLASIGFATTAVAATGLAENAGHGAESPGKSPEKPEFVVFSKVYQELNLNYRQAARVTAAIGLDGVDAAVRPGGEVLPERVREDLPKYVEALRARDLHMPMIATGITGPQSPEAETTLRVARRLGVRYYRLGPRHPDPDKPLAGQIREFRSGLKELAAMNKELGITGVLQNHSPSGRNSYLGGDLAQMRELLEGLDPASLGLAFDIGHALVVHGGEWRKLFEPLKPSLRIVYLKDVQRPSQWLPMGEGEIGKTGFFEYLRQVRYSAPVSIHVEYPWHPGTTRDAATLIRSLKRDLERVRRWFD
jgi:sugar phosphate isomerase/epimerase